MTVTATPSTLPPAVVRRVPTPPPAQRTAPAHVAPAVVQRPVVSRRSG